ncbi:MAG: binding-protein-dependent transport system inner rane component [Frankiales bacterium]|jgi:oligopeptide transport system permease protein|nr:binding-protein-dependent transport system inner rane component [Frankiales bacterium]
MSRTPPLDSDAADAPDLQGPALQPTEGGVEQAQNAKTEDALVAASGGSVRQASLWSDAWRSLRRNPVFVAAGVLLLVLSVMALFPGLFTNTDPLTCDLKNSRLGPGSNGAWFGYDLQGCDYYSNIIYGARVSMAIGLLVVGGSLVIGIFLGSLAGFYGGWFDSLMSRITDIFFGLPLILGAIILLNAFTGSRGLLQVSVALIAFGWMTILRLLRSSVISVKQADYVQAARALGANDWRIITTHILPNAIAPVLVYATIAIGGIIATEATLSFLGIGLQKPSISWGLQINEARAFIRTSPYLMLIPSAFLSVTVLCFIMLGDALRDALDPKLR